MRHRARTLLFAATAAICLSAAVPAAAQERPFRQEVISLTTSEHRSFANLITFPREGMNLDAPVIIHCHGGPGASPLDGSGPWIAAGMAARGYTVIAPAMTHGERLFDSDFRDYDKDVKAVVDYVAGLGFKQIVLTGSSFGSITISRYMVDIKDPRITALIHFAPTEDTGPFTLRGMGQEEFYKQNMAAAAMVARNATDEVFAPGFDAPAPMPPGTKFSFWSTPDRWIDMWGIGYGAVNIGLFPQMKLPMLLLAGGKDGYNTEERLHRLKAAATSSPKVDILFYPGEVDHSFNSNPPVQPKVVADVAAWLAGIGHGVRQPVRTEVFTITDTEPGTRALRYVPSQGIKPGVAFLAIHDFAGSALSGPPNWLAEGAAQAGYFSIGVHSNRGSRGMTSGTYATSGKDIGSWVDYLQKHGFEKVVLVGHGFGATRAAQYLAATGDKRVAGLVMAAPAPDSADFLRARIGQAAYDKALASAAAHADSADYRDLIYLKNVPEGVPTDMVGTLVMSPAAFLDAWGPKAPVASSIVGKLGIPVLVLAGSKDARLDAVAIEKLTRAKNVKAIVYDGSDTILSGEQVKAADDMIAWAASRKIVDPAAAAVIAPVAPVATGTPGAIPAASPHNGKVGGTPETVG